ncbi:MAG TPA: cellulose binding domain-containing protein [Actinocrinis sp.]|jgi:cellulose 1,4-beta-cellobiosidase
MNNAPPISRRRLAALVAVTGALALLALCIAIASGTVANAASSSAAAPSAACTVDYTVESTWGTGFQARIVITNEGAALSTWELQYSYDGPATLAAGLGASWSQSGAAVTAARGRDDGALASGASTSVSAKFSIAGRSAAPTGFTLDGAPCTGTVTAPVNLGR